jgi:hypothetical protein
MQQIADEPNVLNQMQAREGKERGTEEENNLRKNGGILSSRK